VHQDDDVINFRRTEMTNAMPLVLSYPTKLIRTAVVCFCMLFSVETPAQQPEIIGIGPSSEPTFSTFEAPGAGTGASQGTIPFSINTAGAVAGMYYDANNAYHGFVRAATGTITTFEAPGAGTGAAQGTVSFSINTAGDIAGTYLDPRYVYHGFVRKP
jgi:hypothetical protein